MKALKRFVTRVVSNLRKIMEPDFTATHYSSYISTHSRHEDALDLSLPGIPRGTGQDDYLAGYPHRTHQNAPLAGFPARAGMVAGHGWRMPTPPRLPVED